MKLTGVYIVKSQATQEVVYISGSFDIRYDWFNQLILLRNGKHTVQKLQDHFNKYGNKDLIMSIEERSNVISKTDLNAKIKKHEEKLKKEKPAEKKLPESDSGSPEVDIPKIIKKKITRKKPK